MAFFQQYPRHHGRNSKAQIGRHTAARLHRRTPCNKLFYAVLSMGKTSPWADNLPRYCRVMRGCRGLFLVRVQHDQIHQMPRHAHIMRAQGSRRRHPLDLRNHQTAMVAHGNGLIEAAQIRAFVFISQIAAFVRRGGAQDADIRHDIGEMQPCLTTKFRALHNRRRSAARVHRTAFADRVNKGIKPNLGHHARLSRRHIAVHIKHDAGRHIIGGNTVFHDHPPDIGHRQVG